MHFVLIHELSTTVSSIVVQPGTHLRCQFYKATVFLGLTLPKQWNGYSTLIEQIFCCFLSKSLYTKFSRNNRHPCSSAQIASTHLITGVVVQALPMPLTIQELGH